MLKENVQSSPIDSDPEIESDPAKAFEELKRLYGKYDRYSNITLSEGGQEVSYADSEEGKENKAKRDAIWARYGAEPQFMEYRAELVARNEAMKRETKKIINNFFREKDPKKISDSRNILGAAATDNSAAVRRAYLKKAKEFHPDHNAGNVDAARVKFEEAKEAYDYLKSLKLAD